MSNAKQLLAQAEKKKSGASSGGWLGSLGLANPETKFEEAAELFNKAAAEFRKEKNYVEAGNAYIKEAECYEKCKSLENDASNAYWNASKVFKSGSEFNRAITCLEKVVENNVSKNRFRPAADRKKDIGQIYKDNGDLKNACDSFEQAADWYMDEGAEATATTLFRDAADLHVQLNDFASAITKYQQVAKLWMKSPLSKFGVREIWLKQGVCALANTDVVTAGRMLADFGQEDPTFTSTRESRFLTSLIDAVEAGDSEAFSNACVDYDHVSKFDAWWTNLLLKIKNGLDEEPALT